MDQEGKDDHQQPSERRVPECRDLRLFMGDFFASGLYLNGDPERNTLGLNGYLKNVEHVTNATHEEKVRIFNSSEEVKALMMRFARKYQKLVYDPNFYSQEINGLYSQYRLRVEGQKDSEDEKASTGEKQAKILQLDSERELYHNLLAKKLTEEGLSPTERLGRVVARLFLISENLDTFEQMSAEELGRINRLAQMY